jgi:hypothetical protein
MTGRPIAATHLPLVRHSFATPPVFRIADHPPKSKHSHAPCRL